MNELEDIKLKALLHEMKLESPGSNFSFRVMNKIFEEDSVLEKIKSQRILGKGFWIIIVLFILLFIVMIAMSNSGIPTESKLQSLLPQLNSGISAGYQSLFSKLGTVPISIAAMFLASSILLFIERFISSNSRVFV